MRLFTKEELMERIRRFQNLLAQSDIEIALFTTNSDLFYFTGSIQRGVLAIPHTGDPVWFVRKNVERAAEESTIEIRRWDKEHMPAYFSNFASFGFTFDTLSVFELSLFTKKVLPPHAKTGDCSALLAKAKSVKFPSELALIRKAAAINNGIMRLVPELWRPGMTDATMLSHIEFAAKEQFHHQELLWTRGYNMDATMATCVTGTSSLEPTYTDFPIGGRGVSPAVAQGPSDEIITDSFVVDFVGTVHGYNADSTRTFFTSPPPTHIRKTYGELVETLSFIENTMRIGVTGEEIWNALQQHIKQYDWHNQFMGLTQKVSFVGHGIGVEVNQLPVFAPRQKMAIENNMVIAVEPKIFIPDYGIIGIENTYHISDGTPISLMDEHRDIEQFVISDR